MKSARRIALAGSAAAFLAGAAFATAPSPRRIAEAPRFAPATLDGSLSVTDRARLPGWQVRVESATGFAQRLYGPGLAVPSQTAEGLLEFARAFVRDHASLTGVDASDLVARAPVHAGRFTFVILDQTWRGIPIDGARTELRFTGGRMAMARFALAHALDDVDPVARLSGARAEAIALEAARDLAHRAPQGAPLAGAPVIVHGGDAWRLAIPVVQAVSDPPGRLTLFVDARDGGILGIRDAFLYDTPTTLTVTGSHESRRVGDPLVVSPFGFTAVAAGAQSVVADSTGAATLAVPPGGVTAAIGFSGPFVEEVLFATSARTTAMVPMTPGAPAAWVWDDSNSTIAERDLFAYRIEVHARHKAMAPDLPWVDAPLSYRLEVVDAHGCNAYWDGSGVNLFAESTDCNDTARVADVVYHETTHGLHQHLSSGGFVAADIGEGSADYVAASITGDPEIGPTFFKATPAGIRNLEPDLRYPDDVTGEPHGDGRIWGGAFWDLRTRFIALLGSAQGIALADRLLADTLRGDPTLDDGFYDALFADDDDADASNGTPHECDLVQSFGAHGLGPGDGLAIQHRPLDAQPAGPGAYAVRLRATPAFAGCGDSSLASGQLSWRLAGAAAWTAVAMHADVVPGAFVALIPGQADGARVEYRLRVLDASGRAATAPVAHADTQPFSFPVGEATRVFFDDFETERGWTHRLLSAAVFLGADDWQRGAPRGEAGDPRTPFSGASVWGNDLGLDGFDGAYANGVRNRLESPEIDARHSSGVHLRFRRWLNVQSAPFDEARILVNGHPVWTNPAGESVRDREWRMEDVDLSPFADGRRIRVAFDLKTDATISRGGWTIDDVEIVAHGTRSPVESCDAGAAGTPVAGLVLVPLLAAVAIRRRACRA